MTSSQHDCAYNSKDTLIHYLLIFLQFALMDLCLSQEISQVWARLEVTHQLKNQFLIVQIDALVRQIAVRLNILLLKKIAI